MRAVGSWTYGGPEVLEVVELPDLAPGVGEILVRIHAAAVSWTDLAVSSGGFAERQKGLPRPYVPGMDAAGTVAAIGPDTHTPLQVGDPVIGLADQSGQHGTYAEYIVLPANSVVRAPSNYDLIHASTLPMNGMTARQTLDVLDLQPGQTIAVTGAAGTYGGYVVQLAKAEGLTVVADAAPKDRALVAELGADIILERGPGYPERVREEFPDGVDGAADGACMDGIVATAVRDGGTVATVRGYDQPGERGIQFRPIWVRKYAQERDKLAGLVSLVEDGSTTLRVARTYPPEQAGQAQQALAAGGTRGRNVILFA